MAGKLYLPMSLQPDLATLKAVREAAKVAHNRELSWDPFNLRIAIKRQFNASEALEHSIQEPGQSTGKRSGERFFRWG